MKKILVTGILVFSIYLTKAQVFTSSDDSKCRIQVAYAIYEGDGFGEYSITRLIELDPGKSHDYRKEEFVSRQIYSRVEYNEMFIVRFEPTGRTHFLDATVPNGYEAYLNGGCSVDQRPFYSKDGKFIIEASAN